MPKGKADGWNLPGKNKEDNYLISGKFIFANKTFSKLKEQIVIFSLRINYMGIPENKHPVNKQSKLLYDLWAIFLRDTATAYNLLLLYRVSRD